MGIVRTQSIIGSIVIYAGAILGFITSALLFPTFLTPEQIGLLSLLVTYGVLFAQLASAGFLHTITRMFPYFRDKKNGHNGFLRLSLLVVTIGSVCMIGVYFLIEPLLVANSTQQNTLFTEYAILIIPLFLSILYFNVFDTYTKSLFNATRGIIQKEFVLRIYIIITFILFYFQLIQFSSFVYLYIVAYACIMIYMAVRLIGEGDFNLAAPKTPYSASMKQELRNVSIYGFLITAAGFIILNIDRIMIEKLVASNPLAQVGIYTTCTYFATMIILPSRSLIKISSTIIAEAWKQGDMQKLQEVYEKSTINQSIIGVLVFIGILINIDTIFAILPDVYSQGLWVIVFISIFYLSEMCAGVAASIISNSPHYKILSHITFAFIALIIILNYIYIPKYGISGAAASSCVAKILYNVAIYVFIKRKFKLQPYSYNHIKIFIIAAISFFAAYIIPDFSHYIVNFLIKSTVVVGVFSALILYFRVSTDISEMLTHFLKSKK